jgi:hypothetical protein
VAGADIGEGSESRSPIGSSIKLNCHPLSYEFAAVGAKVGLLKVPTEGDHP